MSKPKLSTKTPDDPTTNALIEVHDSIVSLPTERRIAIVELSVPKIETNPGTGSHQATVQVVHLELLTGSDREAGEKLFTKVHHARTGNKTRPAPEAEDTPLDGLGDLGGIDDGV